MVWVSRGVLAYFWRFRQWPGRWSRGSKLLCLVALAALPLFHQGGSHLNDFLEVAALFW